MLAGPSVVKAEAIVAGNGPPGKPDGASPRTNEWVCIPATKTLSER